MYGCIGTMWPGDAGGSVMVARAPVWPEKPMRSGLNFDAQA